MTVQSAITCVLIALGALLALQAAILVGLKLTLRFTPPDVNEIDLDRGDLPPAARSFLRESIGPIASEGFELGATLYTRQSGVPNYSAVFLDRKTATTAAAMCICMPNAPDRVFATYTEAETHFIDGSVLNTNSSPQVLPSIGTVRFAQVPVGTAFRDVLQCHRHLLRGMVTRPYTADLNGDWWVARGDKARIAMMSTEERLGRARRVAEATWVLTWRGTLAMVPYVLWPWSLIGREKRTRQRNRLARDAGIAR